MIRDYKEPITLLKDIISRRPQLGEMIVDSLQEAKTHAEADLSEVVYDALPWPVTLEKYYDYLEWYAKWTPQQYDLEAFLVPGTDDQYQTCYILLCHFYFLIDQELEDGVIAQNDLVFKWWLVLYAEYWGSYLDTPESFNEEILKSFMTKAPQYRVQDSMITRYGKYIPNNPSGWISFNQFFARALNGGLRPITLPMSNFSVASGADCTFMETFPIDADSNVISGETAPRIKFTHSIGNIKDLLKESPYAEHFANGTYVHYFLNTFSYHRFHAPVSGTLRECRTVRGLTYLDVKIKDDGTFDAPDSALDGYEFQQARGLTIWDTTTSKYGNVGLIACLPVGMAQVSSAVMTGTTNKEYLKGDEFGFFQFGGSDIILLFQEGALEQLSATDPKGYIFNGEEVAKCKTPESQKMNKGGCCC